MKKGRINSKHLSSIEISIMGCTHEHKNTLEGKRKHYVKHIM